MLNLRGLFALLVVVSILLAGGYAVPFGIDMWNDVHTAGTGRTRSGVLNYRGVGGIAAGLGMAVFFFLLYCWKKD
jgi:hypothetical protein